MPMNTNFSPAGQALFGGIPGLTAVAGLGVQLNPTKKESGDWRSLRCRAASSLRVRRPRRRVCLVRRWAA